MEHPLKLIGPFRQILTMRDLPLKGALHDDELEVIADGGILESEGRIVDIGNFNHLLKRNPSQVETPIGVDSVCLPGLVDAHTHICYAGSRAGDYAMRSAGKTYLEIAQAGGGIWSTVQATRSASSNQLLNLTKERAKKLLTSGITTAEVKSGYGLDVKQELKMLRVINQLNDDLDIDLIPTCLAAHVLPKDFSGNNDDYLTHLIEDLLPKVKKESLSNRVDIFIEESAFSEDQGIRYLKEAKAFGFEITVHADQFHTGGSEAAIACGAVSADHLEASGDREIQLLADSDTVAVALPGASLGLGEHFAPARKILDADVALAIASDWNPGSAPMGDLLTQAALLGIYERLTYAEVLAGITFRAAAALRQEEVGRLRQGALCDLVSFPTSDYRDILYYQGSMKPEQVWKRGNEVRRH
ncbi:MAG: imidazolonepropionase [Bacteroidota bacterium]